MGICENYIKDYADALLEHLNNRMFIPMMEKSEIEGEISKVYRMRDRGLITELEAMKCLLEIHEKI